MTNAVENFISATRALIHHILESKSSSPAAPAEKSASAEKPSKPAADKSDRPREFGAPFIQKLRGQEPIRACDVIFGEGDHPFDMPRPAKRALYAIAGVIAGEKVLKTELKPVAEALRVANEPDAVIKRVKRRLVDAVAAVYSEESGSDASEGDKSPPDDSPEEVPEPRQEDEETFDPPSEPEAEPDAEEEPADAAGAEEPSPEAPAVFSGKLGDPNEPGPDEMFEPPDDVLSAAQDLYDSNIGDDDFYPDDDAILAEMGAFHWAHIPAAERKSYLTLIAKKRKSEAAVRYLSRGIGADALDERVGGESPVVQYLTGDGPDDKIIMPMCCYVPLNLNESAAKNGMVPATCYVCSTSYSIDENSGAVTKSAKKPAKK